MKKVFLVLGVIWTTAVFADFSADKATAAVGETIALNWSSSASSCTAFEDWSGSKSANGSEQVEVTKLQWNVYGISCGGVSEWVYVWGIEASTTTSESSSSNNATALIISVLEDTSGISVLQIEGANSGFTAGGSTTSSKRTVYLYTPDGNATSPTYSGSSWPYVTSSIGTTISQPTTVTASVTIDSSGQVLVNNKPAYQYTGDSSSSTKSGDGINEVWFAFRIDGSGTNTTSNSNSSSTSDSSTSGSDTSSTSGSSAGQTSTGSSSTSSSASTTPSTGGDSEEDDDSSETSTPGGFDLSYFLSELPDFFGLETSSSYSSSGASTGSSTGEGNYGSSATLSLDTSSTRVNESVTLTWSSSNASSCSASGDWSGSKSTSGSESLTVTERGTKTYTLSCGTVNKSVELGVLCVHSDTNDGTLVSSLEGLRTEISRVEGDGIDDIIYLQSGTYVFDEENPIKYHAKETVEKISIIGCHPDDVVIDGNSLSHVFFFSSLHEDSFDYVGEYDASADGAVQMKVYNPPHPSLHLEGITIQNGVMPISPSTTGREQRELGYTLYEGGAVGTTYFFAKFVNMKFINNELTTSTIAGAEIFDSFFSGNRGGVNVNSAHIKNSIFEENITYFGSPQLNFGGCSDHQLSNGIVSLLEDSTFSDGGSISFHGCPNRQSSEGWIPTEPLIVRNSTFQRNNKSIHIDGPVEIYDSKFLDNYNGRYGPISSLGETPFCISESYFPCQTGGAIDIQNFYYGPWTITITNSEFKNNSAADYGGAISYMGSRDCEVTHQSDDFTGDDDDPDGGEPCVPSNYSGLPDYSLIVRDSVFEGNSSHRGAAITVAKRPLGNATWFLSGNILLENTSFINNQGIANPDVIESTTMMRTYGNWGYPVQNPPEDEMYTSIVTAGGNIDANNITLSGNSADRIIDAKGILTCDPSCSQ